MTCVRTGMTYVRACRDHYVNQVWVANPVLSFIHKNVPNIRESQKLTLPCFIRTNITSSQTVKKLDS